MSCQYCEGREFIPRDGYGCFLITTVTWRKMDGNEITKPVIQFTASDSVFDIDIEIEDYAQIKFCPMCGERLVDE